MRRTLFDPRSLGQALGLGVGEELLEQPLLVLLAVRLVDRRERQSHLGELRDDLVVRQRAHACDGGVRARLDRRALVPRVLVPVGLVALRSGAIVPQRVRPREPRPAIRGNHIAGLHLSYRTSSPALQSDLREEVSGARRRHRFVVQLLSIRVMGRVKDGQDDRLLQWARNSAGSTRIERAASLRRLGHAPTRCLRQRRSARGTAPADRVGRRRARAPTPRQTSAPLELRGAPTLPLPPKRSPKKLH